MRTIPAPHRRGLLAAAGFAAVVVVAVVAAAGDVYAAVGNPAPGPLTSFGTSLLRLIADAAGVACVGGLAFAAFLSPPGESGRLSPDGYAATRTAAGAAVVWALAAAVLVPFDAADASGRPVFEAWHLADLAVLVDAMEEPKAWLCVLAVATTVAIGVWCTLTWRTTVWWLGLAVVGLLPRAIAGHVSIGAWHDLATNALVWHVIAAALWTGSLVALLLHVRGSGSAREVALRRYRRLATCCLVVLAASGIVDGLALARPAGLSTGYGFLLGVKVVITVVLAVLIAATRRRWGGGKAALVVEVVVLAGAMGVSAGLAHLVPPAFVDDPATVGETVLGYDLPDPPTFARLFLDWRPDLLLGVVAVLAVAAYAVGARRLRIRGDDWPRGRFWAWTCGWAT
ncbi:cytochrome c oxidase assembly protein, partial [Amycolatopsis sp. NPDC000673]